MFCILAWDYADGPFPKTRRECGGPADPCKPWRLWTPYLVHVTLGAVHTFLHHSPFCLTWAVTEHVCWGIHQQNCWRSGSPVPLNRSNNAIYQQQMGTQGFFYNTYEHFFSKASISFRRNDSPRVTQCIRCYMQQMKLTCHVYLVLKTWKLHLVSRRIITSIKSIPSYCTNASQGFKVKELWLQVFHAFFRVSHRSAPKDATQVIHFSAATLVRLFLSSYLNAGPLPSANLSLFKNNWY